MGYVVKHSTSNVNKTRRKGNVALGVSSEGYDKTSVSGFYAGVPPVEGKHNFVRTSATGDPNFYCANDTELINFVNGLGERNLTTTTPSQGGWAGSYSLLDNNNRNFRFNVSNFNGDAGSGQGWRSFTWDLRAYTGQSVTISATVEVPAASPGTFAWIRMGQTNTHTNNGSGAGTFMGYSAASEYIHKSTSTTERITWSGTLGNSGTASQPSGHVGFTVWYNGGTSGVNSYIDVSNVQIEIEDHATEFSSPNLSVFYTLEAKNYLNSRSDIFFTDNPILNNIVTDGLVLNLNAKNQSSFIDNQPTENLISDPLYALGIKNEYHDTNNTGWGTVTRGKIEKIDGPLGRSVQAYSQELISYTSGNRSIEGQPQEVVNNANCLFNLTSGVTYRISVWIKATYTGTSQNRLYLSGQTAVGDNVNRQVTTEWQRFSKTYTPASTGNYYMRHYDYSTKNTGDKIWYSFPQVEIDQGYETSFVSGSRSQNTTWYDLSGNGAHAEAVNMPDYNSNGYFTFSGDDEFQSVDISQEYRDLLITLKTTKASGLHMVFGHYDDTDDSLRFEGPYIRTSGNIDLNDWHSGSISDVFIDGNFNALDNGNVALNNKFHFLRAYRSNNSGFGSSFRYEISSAFNNRYFEGELASITAYNRKLTNAEVLQNYYGSPIVTDGLVLALDGGNLVSYEQTGSTLYNLTDTSVSASIVNGAGSGNIISLDGTNDWIGVNNSVTSATLSPSVATFSIWFRANDTYSSGNTCSLISRGNYNNSGGFFIHMRNISGNCQVSATFSKSTTTSYQFEGTSNITLNPFGEWNNVTVSVDSSIKLYANGELLQTVSRSVSNIIYGNGTINTNGDTNLAILSSLGYAPTLDQGAGGTWRPYNGDFGNMFMYNRVLTPAEVLQNYNAQRNRFL